MMAIFGAILPRFALLAAWSNDQTYWASLFGSPIWFLGGFLFFPWTTLIYGFAQVNGLSLLNWIFILCGVRSTSGRGASGRLPPARRSPTTGEPEPARPAARRTPPTRRRRGWWTHR